MLEAFRAVQEERTWSYSHFKHAGRGKRRSLRGAPHFVDDETLAWGMTECRTCKNVMENPNVAYLYMYAGAGYSGARLSLKLKGIENSGDMFDTIKVRTREIGHQHLFSTRTLINKSHYF
jgi:hypothetical protein